MAEQPAGGAQPLFGLVPAGQSVIVSPIETPTPTSFLYAIPATSAGAKPFSHIVVFLLPGVVLTPNTAAAIYLVTPAPGMPQPNFKFLGGIGPGKESAIFKLGAGAAGGGENVMLGVSVEPAESVAARMTEASSSGGSGALVGAGGAGARQPSTLILAQRIIQNAFNFLASFSGKAGEVEVVPLKAFEEWWKKFENKVRADPSFLERGS